jgi:hypothetical protein
LSSEDLPYCVVCKKTRTEDAYELDEREMARLEEDFRVRTVRRVMRRYEAVPICRACFDRTGFGLETPRPGEQVIVSIKPRRRTDSTRIDTNRRHE